MDIQRSNKSWFSRVKKFQLPIIGLVLLVTASVALSAYSPGVPSVKRSDLRIGLVERGLFTREVRGPGVLIPNQVRWLTARAPGRIEQIHQLPGSMVSADTLLLELSNPELEQETSAARLAFVAAGAEHKALLAQLAEFQLEQEVRLLEARTNLEQAEFRYAAELKLAETNIVSEVDLNESRLSVQQNKARLELEQKRSAAMPTLHEAQIEASRARLAQLEEAWQLQQTSLDSLSVYAGIDGVLQQLNLERGQQVDSGVLLARVADPRDLRAELRVPETLAKDIEYGLVVQIDIRNGTVLGRVSRVDPAVESGTVAVDVEFEQTLPDSARIDQSVDGSIRLQAVNNALYIPRPSQPFVNGRVSLFKLDETGSRAERISIATGATSVLNLQVLSGLQQGDQVILNDLAAFQTEQSITIE